MEVSMPTGSLCAERNVIGNALSDDLTLSRKDIKVIAVYSFPHIENVQQPPLSIMSPAHLLSAHFPEEDNPAKKMKIEVATPSSPHERTWSEASDEKLPPKSPTAKRKIHTLEGSGSKHAPPIVLLPDRTPDNFFRKSKEWQTVQKSIPFADQSDAVCSTHRLRTTFKSIDVDLGYVPYLCCFFSFCYSFI
jgi:hypothetical protein